jgi:hypothetical protein
MSDQSQEQPSAKTPRKSDTSRFVMQSTNEFRVLDKPTGEWVHIDELLRRRRERGELPPEEGDAAQDTAAESSAEAGKATDPARVRAAKPDRVNKAIDGLEQQRLPFTE